MKFTAQRNRVAALNALLPSSAVLRITGGLPADYVAKPPDPPGIDLKAPAAAFRKPAAPAADAPKAPEVASVPPPEVKIAG